MPMRSGSPKCGPTRQATRPRCNCRKSRRRSPRRVPSSPASNSRSRPIRSAASAFLRPKSPVDGPDEEFLRKAGSHLSTPGLRAGMDSSPEQPLVERMARLRPPQQWLVLVVFSLLFAGALDLAALPAALLIGLMLAEILAG